MKEITWKLDEDDQAIIHRALTDLARRTESDGFRVDVQALRGRLVDVQARKRLEDEGKK